MIHHLTAYVPVHDILRLDLTILLWSNGRSSSALLECLTRREIAHGSIAVLVALQSDYTGPLHDRRSEGVYSQEGSEYPPTKAFWSLYPRGLTTAFPQGMFAFNSFLESGPWSVPTDNGQQLLVLYKPLRFPTIRTKEGWVGGYLVYGAVPPPSTTVNIPK